MYTSVHPVTLFRFCPKCGSPDFLPTSDRSKRCNNCSFTYFFNTSAAAAALIFNNKGELLLARRAIEPYKGMLDLPGGFIEHGESAEEGIYREIKEELGVNIVELEYFGSFPNEYPFDGLLVFTLDLVFKATLDCPELIKPMDDISGIEFYRPSEIDLDEIPSSSMKNIIKCLLNRE